MRHQSCSVYQFLYRQQSPTRCNRRASTNFHIMGNLYQIIDNDMIADNRIIQRAAIDTGVACLRWHDRPPPLALIGEFLPTCFIWYCLLGAKTKAVIANAGMAVQS